MSKNRVFLEGRFFSANQSFLKHFLNCVIGWINVGSKKALQLKSFQKHFDWLEKIWPSKVQERHFIFGHVNPQ